MDYEIKLPVRIEAEAYKKPNSYEYGYAYAIIDDSNVRVWAFYSEATAERLASRLNAGNKPPESLLPLMGLDNPILTIIFSDR